MNAGVLTVSVCAVKCVFRSFETTHNFYREKITFIHISTIFTYNSECRDCRATCKEKLATTTLPTLNRFDNLLAICRQ